MSTFGNPFVQSEPVLIRIAGTKAITDKILPRVAGEGLGMAQSSIETASFDLPDALHIRTCLDDYTVRVPVHPGDVKAKFWPAPFHQGKLQAEFDFHGASISFRLVVRSRPYSAWEVWQRLGISPTVYTPPPPEKEHFSCPVRVTGISGAITLTFEIGITQLEVTSVESFRVQVGTVSITDGNLLMTVADTLGGIGKLLGVPGAVTASEAITSAVNFSLSASDFRALVRHVLNGSLRHIGSPSFRSSVTLPDGRVLELSANPCWLTTAIDVAVSAWEVTHLRKWSGGVADLPYSFLPRPRETLAAVDPSVAVEVYIPYSEFDRLLYDLLQGGLLQNLVWPSINAVQVVPLAVPRAKRDPLNPTGLLLELKCLFRGQVGAYGTAVIAEKQVMVNLFFKVRGGVATDVYVEPSAVTIDDLGTTVRTPVGSYTPPWPASLHVEIGQRLLERLRPMVLIPRVMNLEGLGLAVQAGSPTLGSQYVRLPMRIL